ncbi:MAG: homoserine dehydrogenase, partial [Actinobacteria bacterium]|nr:homoserine dehydrogenase [Actinomycetota bacterium]
EMLLAAIKNGKSVITANKALLGLHGAELFEAADKNGVDLYYEAAVGGAIPILRPLRESIVGDHVHRVMGIVNGTTNYILTKMDEEGSAFADVLKEAQALGFAEADPTADIEGHDAAAKAAILAGLAFHTRVTTKDVSCEGISKISARDVAVAREMDHVIKLLAIAELTADQQVSVRVHPTLISRQHPLASVRNAFNAVFVEAESAGELMFYGRGAGGAPTASAILGDLIAIARNKTSGGEGHGESDYAEISIAPLDNVKSRYLIRLDVADKPGVLATVAQLFASNSVSIETVRQSGRGDGRVRQLPHRGRQCQRHRVVLGQQQLRPVQWANGQLRRGGRSRGLRTHRGVDQRRIRVRVGSRRPGPDQRAVRAVRRRAGGRRLASQHRAQV